MRGTLRIGRLLVLGATVFSLLPVGPSLAGAPVEADQAMELEVPGIIDDFNVGAVGSGEDQVVPTGFSSGYRLYHLDISKLAALEGEYDQAVIGSIIEDVGEWVYPLIDETGKVVSSASIRKDDEGWGLVDLPTYSSNDAVAFSADEPAVREYLAAQGVEDVRDIKVAHLNMGWQYIMDLLLFESAGEPYIIPLSRNFGDLHLENKKVYRAAELLEALAAKDMEMSDASAKSTLQISGSTAEREAQETAPAPVALRYLPAVAVAILAGGIALVFRRRVKHQ